VTPYFGLRSYQDGGKHYDGQIGAEATPAEFVDALIAATREMVRVVKPSGSIWVNLGDKYAAGSTPGPQSASTTMTGGAHKGVSNITKRTLGTDCVKQKSLLGIPWRYAIRCIDELGLILRAEVIWSKPNGMPESVTDRVRRSHEQWFHFTRQPRYYSAVDEIREPHVATQTGRDTTAWRPGPNYPNRGTHVGVRHEDGGRVADFALSPLGKLPGSVWQVATEPLRVPESLGVDHFAAFPTEWPRRIIQGWSPIGATVLDPFGGTGTTALCADVLGRHGISVDMSADYCRLAQWRTADPKQRAHAARVAQPPAVPDGQLDLFCGAV